MVAVKDIEGWVIDTKTGSPKTSDRVQVMIYMWALPKAIPAFAGVTFHGKVDSFQAGTGAAFSVLPAENATGNYVKIVQRLPVKIVFDDQRMKDYPLAPGMSVTPSVRVR